MKLIVLGSSSRGNCYVLKPDSGKYLVIECGVKLAKLKAAVNFNVRDCAGILISHEHADHAGAVEQAMRACLPIYMSEGTASAINTEIDPFGVHFMKPLMRYQIADFAVCPFPVEHDAAEPFGFVIDHPESGRILFATDTAFIPHKFAGLNNIMIECNYRTDILNANVRSGKIRKPVRDRIIGSHMSFQTCRDTLIENDLSAVVNIVLIHLSSDNSDAEEFRRGIAGATNKNVVIARPGTEIEFNNQPF